MATTSIWRVKGWLGKVVIYVENPDKTTNPKFYTEEDMTERDGRELSDVIRYAVNSEKTQQAENEDCTVVHRFVCKTYQAGEAEVKALDNVSFAVEKGEFVSIIGPSGSGKSTLLHILAGIDRPTSGKVYVDGEDIYAKSEKELAYYRRRKAGLIYQFYNLVPTLTVEENITLPCRLDKKKTDKETLDRLLDTLGMKERRSHLPSQLSGGQQQRCAIGRVLFTNPALMLADEPTGNLDSKSAAEVMELLGSANKQYGQTLIMITHNLELAKLADRMLIIKDGKLSEG